MPGAHDNRRDRELLEHLASGGADALAELYERHAKSLFRHAVVLAGQRADAEDLVHAVFVKLATTGAELLGVREPRSYLHRMVHTAWIDARRRSAVAARMLEHAERDSVVRQDDPGNPDLEIDVARALASLPVPQREAIVLHLVDGFSFREIGRQTGVSLFTAAGRYRLGMRRLHDMLQPAVRKTT